jgi:multiple sugar transport system ATP-binding protein
MVCGEKRFISRCQHTERSDIVPARVSLGFRSEDICLGDSAPNDSLSGNAHVLSVEAMGAESQVFLEDGELTMVAKVLGYTKIKPGEDIFYGVPREKLHIFDAQTGRRVNIG